MGNPVVDSVGRGSREPSSTQCPLLSNGRDTERNPFRGIRMAVPMAVPINGDTDRSSVWTRNIRQRGEVMHTVAPAELDDELMPDSAPASEQDSLEESIPERPADSDGSQTSERHKYRLRLGYDPRIFLEDPRLRCHQLSQEAEKWAAEYRTQIPMATAPQLARRFAPEQSRHTQTDSGELLRARRGFQRRREEGPPTGSRDGSGDESEDEYFIEVPREGDERQAHQPLAFLSDVLLHGVSPDDFTSRIEDSLAVLNQGLRSGAARTVGVQAARAPSAQVLRQLASRFPRSDAPANADDDAPAGVDRPTSDHENRTYQRNITRVAAYIQRQAGGGPDSPPSRPDIV